MKQFLWLVPCALLLPFFASAAPVAAEGGIDGGGGGTLPAEPSSVSKIAEVVRKQALLDLRYYARYRQWGYQAGSSAPIEQKLFGAAEPNLWTLLATTDIELLENGACHDASGNEVDGSIHASRPNTICLSAPRIAAKVDDSQATLQTEALIVHELSHLLGSTEEEARLVQKDFAYYAHRRRDDETRSLAQSQLDLIDGVSTSLYALEGRLERKVEISDEDLAVALERMEEDFSKFQQAVVNTNFAASLLDGPGLDYLRVQDARFMLAAWYMRGLVDTASGGSWQQLAYDEVFQKDESVTYAQFAERHFHDQNSDNRFAGEVIQRLHNRDEVLALLPSLHAYVKEQADVARAFFFGLAVPRTHGPWSGPAANPWEKFVGRYDVKSVRCNEAGKGFNSWSKLKQFEVLRASDGRVRVREASESSSGTEDTFDGGGDMLGGSTVTVDGDASRVVRKAEFGNPWGDHWVVKKKVLHREDEDYVLDYEHFGRDRDFGGRLSETTATCSFHLKKRAD